MVLHGTAIKNGLSFPKVVKPTYKTMPPGAMNPSMASLTGRSMKQLSATRKKTVMVH